MIKCFLFFSSLRVFCFNLDKTICFPEHLRPQIEGINTSDLRGVYCTDPLVFKTLLQRVQLGYTHPLYLFIDA